MVRSRKSLLSFMMLSLLGLATGALAVEDIDCINYADVPDTRCRYNRIDKIIGPYLFVVPDEYRDNPTLENAIKGASFYVYAPEKKSYGRDSLILELLSDGTEVKNLQAVTSDSSSGRLNLKICSLYPRNNFYLGTSNDELASDPQLSLVYNFYAPELRYFDEDGNEINQDSKLSMEVGDTMLVRVEATIPIGPTKGELDTLEKTFYIDPLGESASIEYLSEGGTSLKKSDGRIYLEMKEGRASFLMVATKAITDGSKFTLNAFDRGKDSDGKIKYVVTEEFPGSYEFTNPGMPTLDKAVIYDTDGDGIGDSIATWFGGNMDSADVDKFRYSWPDDSTLKDYSGDVKRDGSEYGLPDVEVNVQTDSATGVVEAHVCTTVGDRCETLKTTLVDSIGAAIQSATLLKGKDGSQDTLIVRFNKDVDSTWTSGQGLKLNGVSIDVAAFSKEGNLWAFTVDSGVVQVGDKLKIETFCKSSECPDGILTAADGVPTSANNQEVQVQDAGRVLVDNENSGFYDRDGDGRMDSASVGFEVPLTKDSLKNMDITFYWLDSDGELVAIKPNLSDLTLSADGMVLGYALDPEKYDIKKMLTGIDKSYSKDGKVEYGYTTVATKLTVDGHDTTESVDFGMHDYMAPVISSTFLKPESFQRMETDKFRVTFSEAMDYKNMELSDDCLEFYVDGAWVHYDLSSAEWSEDGRSVTFYMESGEELSQRMNPADSVRFSNFTKGLVDKEGNKVSEQAPTVMIEGDPRVIMQTTSFANLNKAAELSDRVKPFTIDHVENASEASDQSSLGVLMDVGFSTIMKQDSVKGIVPNLKDIGLSWELYVYTNLGAYVGSASGNIACDDDFFDGNCLENPDKLYVRWNMRSDNGRRVGVGLYLAKFKIRVHGAQDDFKVERIFRWGISAKNSK